MTFIDHGIQFTRAAFAKIDAIVPLLQQFQFAVADVEGMDEADWRKVARCAAIAEPDQEVRRMIIDKLRELRQQRFVGGRHLSA